MNRKPITFNDYENGPDFDRARIGIATPFQYIDLDLTNAASNQMIEIAGDFLYFDTADGYDGVITLELNNEHNTKNAPFTGRPGFALNALFKRIRCSWDAQAGKRVRILYSTGERVIPALTGTLNVTGTVDTEEQVVQYGGSWAYATDLAGNTAVQIVAPAANLNGVIIHSGFAKAQDTERMSFVAKASAPANVIDGDPLQNSIGQAFMSSSARAFIAINRPIKVPAGKGIYLISQTIAAQLNAGMLYTVLP